MNKRILILGGTAEAFQLAEHLASTPALTVISSLAGRVAQPKLPPGEVRIGGFGGINGLTSYLLAENIAAVIDATHPYAATISHNAEQACNSLTIPLIAYERPPWQPHPHDRWHHIPDAPAAAELVDHENNRVFLSIGRQELAAFSCCRNAHFLIRAIDEPEALLPPNSTLILDRGPFNLATELELLRNHRINWIVSKNSGGPATYAKIEAARTLAISVAIVDRPPKHTLPTTASLDELLHALNSQLSTPNSQLEDRSCFGEQQS